MLYVRCYTCAAYKRVRSSPTLDEFHWVVKFIISDRLPNSSNSVNPRYNNPSAASASDGKHSCSAISEKLFGLSVPSGVEVKKFS